MRFMGEDAFPEQFKGWTDEHDEAQYPVVANRMDAESLETGVALPRVDMLLAILSGSTEVRWVVVLPIDSPLGAPRPSSFGTKPLDRGKHWCG